MFTRTAINFNEYFWTPYSFLVLVIIGLIESFLTFKSLSKKSYQKIGKPILLVCLIANVFSFFLEYYFFAFFNGGHRILVWIPWVKIIGQSQLFLYLISFPIIFSVTILSEFIVVLFLLKNEFKWNEILKATFKANFISTIALVVVFNVGVFNLINGEQEGYLDDIMPEISRSAH